MSLMLIFYNDYSQPLIICTPVRFLVPRQVLLGPEMKQGRRYRVHESLNIRIFGIWTRFPSSQNAWIIIG